MVTKLDNVLYTAHAHTTGGGGGKSSTDDGLLQVTLTDVDRSIAQKLINEAHQVCPYSNATRGNIEVDLRLL